MDNFRLEKVLHMKKHQELKNKRILHSLLNELTIQEERINQLMKEISIKKQNYYLLLNEIPINILLIKQSNQYINIVQDELKQELIELDKLTFKISNCKIELIKM